MYGYPLRHNNRGQALILAYVIIAILVVICAALSSKAVTEKNNISRDTMTAEAFYMAEGGIENAISTFAQEIADYQIAADVANLTTNTTFSSLGNTMVSAMITRLENNDRVVMDGQRYVLVRNYEITCSVAHPQNNAITATVHQIVARRLIPTFQHFAFYNDDLEMLPGKNMNITGRIHCNKDIYTDAESGMTLKIDTTYLHSAGNIYNQRKDSGAQLAGEVSIRVNQAGPAVFQNMANLDCDIPTWENDATDRWKGTVQSAVHGVTELTAPSVASTQTGGYYATNANVVITNNKIVKGGSLLVEGVNYPTGTITARTTLYNNREGKYSKTSDIDLKKLGGYAFGDPPGHPSFPNNIPANGLLYATRNDAGSYEPGVRLVNATEIYRTGGLTVVSNDPVYIQGNYNTVNEKPASVICDSMNLLSGNWKDANSAAGLSSRIATETTVNCAFISGVDTTTNGQYNGGLENYPRLHEDWTSIALNIKGSFVELWNASVATGTWRYGSPQYMAPNRNWIYNTNFNDVNNLPPFTPWAVEAQRIAWWRD